MWIFLRICDFAILCDFIVDTVKISKYKTYRLKNFKNVITLKTFNTKKLIFYFSLDSLRLRMGKLLIQKFGSEKLTGNRILVTPCTIRTPKSLGKGQPRLTKIPPRTLTQKVFAGPVRIVVGSNF